MDHGTTDQAPEILLSRFEIEQRIDELAAEISKDYQGSTPHLVGILKGAWVFMADLIRRVDIEVTVDFLGITSYGSNTHPSGEVKITKDLDTSIKGREVLIVEDILDTGRTLKYLEEVLSAHKPHNLRVVTLLDKRSRRIVPVKADYVGFEIADVFVVGYGLDFDQRYRQLPDIHVLRHVPLP
ncbi:MAG: hypoxanthine phosphoribosyltransferase [Acidobacteria bacterium]|nr:MAG: hypoxanthine phosphoribosyltransferase [Acidobacteriota bacterium]